MQQFTAEQRSQRHTGVQMLPQLFLHSLQDRWELAISESQERMAVALAPEDVDKFIAIATEENLEATPVAKVTEEKRLNMV